MATRCYISYDTTKRYFSCLQILSKDNLVAIGQDIALKIPMSWSKEKMADYNHPMSYHIPKKWYRY